MEARSRKPAWKEWQDVLLLDYYYSAPESAHTDSHPLCVALAKQLGRSSAAVDMRLRNIKSADKGSGLAHVPSSIKVLLQRSIADINAEAARIRTERRMRTLVTPQE